MKFPDNLPQFDSRSGKGTVKGTPVWAEAAASVRWTLVQHWADLASRWGFAPVETPLIEERSVFVHAVGEHTDIVHKEMFAVQDPKGRHQWVLRPEGTAPLMRARVVSGQDWISQRLWYYGPMFRYERPQHGRLRQFSQFGIESYAPSTVAEDLQILLFGEAMLAALPADYRQLEIGALGCKDCRPGFRETLVGYLTQHADHLCSDCRERTLNNPLRCFDCKVDSCQQALVQAPSMQDHLCTACARRQTDTLAGLDDAQVSYILNRRLVRGLDYYNGLVFEWTTRHLGAQAAMAAGGRYDSMSRLYGKEELPAIGFAVGLERVMALLELVTSPDADRRKPGVYWIHLEPGERTWNSLIACLREQVSIDNDFSGRSVKACLRSANRSGWRFAVITGESERLSAQISVRDLQTGEQHTFTRDQLGPWIQNTLKEGDLP